MSGPAARQAVGFITVEGIEGSGKTTQIRTIAEFLQGKRLPFVTTREPGATPIGAKIREILLDPAHRGMDPRTEMLLYMADRGQHVRSVILPALSSGKVVVCDRYVDATVVYQGMARNVEPGLVLKLHDLVLDGLLPDVTFLLDLPAEAGLARAWTRIAREGGGGTQSRFEEESLVFHEKVRQGYLLRARMEPRRFRVIDAGFPVNRVRDALIGHLSSLFP